MILLFRGIFTMFIVFASCQDLGQDAATCSSQPIVNCNCGFNDNPSPSLNVNNQPNIAQGRPGRIGPPGGFGPKGQKGDRGQTDETKNDLRQIQTQINELQAQLEQLRMEKREVQNQMQENELVDNSTTFRGYNELENGWISPSNGYQYKVNPIGQTWDESRRNCQNWGGDLIVHGFRDHTTRQTITRAFGFNNYYWIGLNDQANENNFRWVNGNRAKSDDDSLWYPNRPYTNGENSDCCASYFSDTRWHAYLAWDADCSNEYQSICEKLV